jgi:hypothetical protein
MYVTNSKSLGRSSDYQWAAKYKLFIWMVAVVGSWTLVVGVAWVGWVIYHHV